MNAKILLVAAAIALAPALSSGASVYKWTDDEGVTHFGDRQPTGREAESVKIRSGTSTKVGQSSSPQDKVDAINKREQSAAEKEKLTAQEEAQRKQREANCETARNNLNILNSNARIKVEEDGEQRFLSPEEIEEQRQRFQEIADANC